MFDYFYFKHQKLKIAGALYVVIILVLNFIIDNPNFFYIALTAFPVSLYVLLSRKRRTNEVEETTSPSPENPRYLAEEVEGKI